MNHEELTRLPWESLESWHLSGALHTVVRRIARTWKKKLPATSRQLLDASGSIGGKLARSAAQRQRRLPNRSLLDRHRALKRAHAARRRLELLHHHWNPSNADVLAALELVDRVIHLIRVGK